jgi:hypothetical protein
MAGDGAVAVTERNKIHNVASVAPYAEVMGEVPVSEATGHLDEVANESAATGEVMYLTRDGRRPAAIVPVEVAAGIEAAEDAAGIAAAQAAMAEPEVSLADRHPVAVIDVIDVQATS